MLALASTAAVAPVVKAEAAPEITACRGCEACRPSPVTIASGNEMLTVTGAVPCPICLSKAYSGIGSYPWTCANGHTLTPGTGLNTVGIFTRDNVLGVVER